MGLYSIAAMTYFTILVSTPNIVCLIFLILTQNIYEKIIQNIVICFLKKCYSFLCFSVATSCTFLQLQSFIVYKMFPSKYTIQFSKLIGLPFTHHICHCFSKIVSNYLIFDTFKPSKPASKFCYPDYDIDMDLFEILILFNALLVSKAKFDDFDEWLR